MQSSIPPKQSRGGSSPPHPASTIAGALAGVALAWAVALVGAPFAEPALFAAALCVATAPLAFKLRAAMGRRASSLLLATLLAFGGAAPAAWAWGSSFVQLDELMRAAGAREPAEARNASGWREQAIEAALGVALKARTSPAWRERAERGSGVPWGLVGLLGICVYFMLADGQAAWAWARARTLERLGTGWERALSRGGAAFEQTAKGCLWFGVGSFAILWALFSWAGAPAPMAFAVASACASMLPFVGPVLVASAAAALMAPENFWAPLALLVAGGGGLGIANNVLRPKWIGEAAGIPLPAALFGMAGGAIAWGPAGLLAGPALVAAALSLTRGAALNEPQR